ncbi:MULTISPECIES: hypothetical protein [Cyanophyceae]|uniref:hypothetical protein n=1 Tax=Cyanophyceae TaxID=3028117 RepID=UPI0012E3BF9D|nr:MULTISPECIES: hypothetical protein [Cyanophyceae]MBF2086901.1 hypothetical protein [Thermoleptolyngbya sp. C42_A2020_037]
MTQSTPPTAIFGQDAKTAEPVLPAEEMGQVCHHHSPTLRQTAWEWDDGPFE